MNKREMIEAMLAGETLINDSNASAVYKENEDIPFRFISSEGYEQGLKLAWNCNWRIKPSLKTRPMTRDEVLGFIVNTPGIVVRLNNDDWLPPGMFNYRSSATYEWATITPDGVIGEAKRFVKEVEA